LFAKADKCATQFTPHLPGLREFSRTGFSLSALDLWGKRNSQEKKSKEEVKRRQAEACPTKRQIDSLQGDKLL
jgi:hypothetical protein